jgi:hypothetical protein
MRGFALVMGVERDRHYGAAIAKSGTLEPHAKWIAPLLAALAEIDWPSLRRRASIAVVDGRADARFGIATSLLDPVTPILTEALGLGPGGAAELGTDAAATAARRWHAAVCAALELVQVPYAIVDESAAEDELAGYRAVIVPTLARIDRGLYRRITALAEHKRAIVVIGPDTPTRDELDQPLSDPPPRRVGRLKAGSLEDLPGLADDLGALAGELPEAWQIERPDSVRAHAFCDPANQARIVFVLSDADKPVTASLLVDATTKSLRDPLTREQLAIRDGRAQIAITVRGVRMLIVE